MYEHYKTAQKKFWHPMSSSAPANRSKTLIIARGDGNYITDIEGHRMLDGVGGLWNVNVGHNRPSVKAAIAAQLDELAYYQTFDGIAHPRVFDLAERLTSMFAQENMARVLFSSGGSDAVETALKMARQYWIASGEPGRTRFLSLRNGYHGVHMGGTSVGGNGVYHYNHGPLLAGCHLLDTPWLYRNPWDCRDPEELTDHCIRQLEDQIALLGSQTIAALVAEPVQGAGGVIVPPAHYWKRLREVCDRHGILLIADEVVTGFGRTGCMLGSRGWGVAPDVLCLAKGITAGYIPMGATVFNQRIADAIENGPGFSSVIMHGYTYSGHPTACAAALAVLDIVEAEDLPGNAGKVGAQLLEQLQPLTERYAVVGEVRGKGLMIAVDLVADKATREPLDPANGLASRIAEQARRAGVLVRPIGNKIVMSPPLTLTSDEAAMMVAALDGALADCR
ncbi:Adenosylmethionine-8-amino-7-oxononanoate aminotransferase [Pseudomonas sp. NFIX10]|uniref:aminotransferase class III-fold pyridoxal phosphate-dependent enzyme n=1 Tax=unclassified Pseudomonas TaxID=196821 RepID=UPI000871458C|nr:MULTISPECIES: aminotransferase class III-fold pyridoxal phosphate-dependent enzyme [unclassified Pseudomonas]SCW29706.1 Adenosylmethionine-8-amino-7-oxononanoate aminotransferase [Pseudomonas sp. NFACC56-3]SFB55285.1 Adenosylmethionine-8-amino-7-oxononanoate aminotransferase [Pseudomonas sp. NFIX10]SFF43449.1 Adenosylmethionine-8-amino-7-oxononanoate aminotransferase [Pseudomonas sp. NFACC06-1]SFK11598.1 Adenosylmethionine-8-amino-7-oxononanoate aminotransferase [Pseudomonas sp. NFACC52]